MGNCCFKSDVVESYHPLHSIPINQKINVRIVQIEDGSCLKVDYNGLKLDCVLHTCKWLSPRYKQECEKLIDTTMYHDVYTLSHHILIHLLTGLSHNDIPMYKTTRLIEMLEPVTITIVKQQERYEIIMYDSHNYESVNKRLNAYFS